MSSLEASSKLISQKIFDINPESSLLEPKSSSWRAETITESESSRSLLKAVAMLLLILVRIYPSSLVVDPPFLGILKKFVRIDNLSELLSGPRILFITIWMILSRSLLKSCFDLFFIRVTFNPENFVGIRNLLSSC